MTDLVLAIILLAIITAMVMLALFMAIGGFLAILGVVSEWVADKIMKLWRNDE